MSDGDAAVGGPGAREPSPQDAVSALRASPPVAENAAALNLYGTVRRLIEFADYCADDAEEDGADTMAEEARAAVARGRAFLSYADALEDVLFAARRLEGFLVKTAGGEGAPVRLAADELYAEELASRLTGLTHALDYARTMAEQGNAALAAQGIEARSAETAGLGAKGESPVPKGDAP